MLDSGETCRHVTDITGTDKTLSTLGLNILQVFIMMSVCVTLQILNYVDFLSHSVPKVAIAQVRHTPQLHPTQSITECNHHRV